MTFCVTFVAVCSHFGSHRSAEESKLAYIGVAYGFPPTYDVVLLVRSIAYNVAGSCTSPGKVTLCP